MVIKQDPQWLVVCDQLKRMAEQICVKALYAKPTSQTLLYLWIVTFCCWQEYEKHNQFATLAGGRLFSRIDLSQAYHQLPLDKKSLKLHSLLQGLLQRQGNFCQTSALNSTIINATHKLVSQHSLQGSPKLQNSARASSSATNATDILAYEISCGT